VFSTDILDKDYFWNEEILKVNKEFLFGCYSISFPGGRGTRKGIIEGHAYSIMKVFSNLSMEALFIELTP
jgi:hypothetical protein